MTGHPARTDALKPNGTPYPNGQAVPDGRSPGLWLLAYAPKAHNTSTVTPPSLTPLRPVGVAGGRGLTPGYA
ncbi:hypothetical protein AcetOrient_orf03940 [Acetobacter orientalis]|uniref:Uncharacterized protein n=1 Tax=Acetobacter orientalis TaxID=146474 RepID=A0A2Z5ZKA1_9PROT|nr:hypothetical protein AcetOrient_orf03940 [Acetobacter orientalis]